MGCLKAEFTRQGSRITAIISREGSLLCNAEQIKRGLIVKSKKESGIIINIAKKGGINCKVGIVCPVNKGTPYLEIEPTIIWVYETDLTENEIKSNTKWHIE